MVSHSLRFLLPWLPWLTRFSTKVSLFLITSASLRVPMLRGGEGILKVSYVAPLNHCGTFRSSTASVRGPNTADNSDDSDYIQGDGSEVSSAAYSEGLPVDTNEGFVGVYVLAGSGNT